MALLPPPGLRRGSSPRSPTSRRLGDVPAPVALAAALGFAVAATGALATVLLTVVLGSAFVALTGTFSRTDARQLQLGAVVVVVVLLLLCGLAVVASWFVLRGRRWAQVVLGVLSLVGAALGLVTAAYALPLLLTLAGLVVTGLLLLPTSRRWFATTPGGPVR
ncbi:MAG: hypothetical protein JWR20_2300 [Marmoricola sp.]|nr:hypothetical protein [Marmoricola sp.]